MNFRAFMEAETARIARNGNEFKAWVGNTKVGQAYLSNHRGGVYTLDAIDVEPEFQRKGYALQLMQSIAQFLKGVGATELKSSNEGSGTIQLLDRTFGRENVQHFHGGQPVPYDHAVKVMDVDFGYTGSTVNLKGVHI